ncbi:MAG: HIT family protein [Candidatus Levyibacteriota bacterium]
MDCVFCDVREGKYGTKFLYQDEDVMVFPDIHPIKPIHLLIVPKEHITEFSVLDNDALWTKMRHITKKMIEEQGLSDKGYRLIVNGGGAQVIDHLHIHLTGPWGKAAAL